MGPDSSKIYLVVRRIYGDTFPLMSHCEFLAAFDTIREAEEFTARIIRQKSIQNIEIEEVPFDI